MDLRCFGCSVYCCINVILDIDNDNDNDSTDRYRDRFASAQVAGSLNRVAGAPDASLDMVANAPDYSADAARLRLPSELMLEYKGIVSDDSMPDIIQKTYAKHIKNHDLSNEEIYDSMVKEFTGGFYRCSEIPVKQACAYVCGIKLEDSGLTDSSADLVSTDITDPSDTKDSSTVVPINQDNTDISGSNPGDAA